MPGLMPIARVLAEIEENPIEGAMLAQKRNDGVRVATYESSVSAGALYRALKGKKALVSAFYGLPFWEGGNARDPKHLNKHCHQFVYGARDGAEGKRAEDHAAATQSYYDDEEKTVEDILEALKRGGFDGLKKAQSAQETRLRLKQMEAPERKQSGAEGSAKNGGAGSAAEATKESHAGTDTPKPPLPKLTMQEVFAHLLVTMEPEELAQFLPDESDEGDVVTIRLIRDKNAVNKMAIWRAVDIVFEPQDSKF